jgi:hypothetical protein
LDPCSPIKRPWETAENYFTIEDDGLNQEWFDRVWLNPPYGKAMAKWIEKLARYGYGTSLLFARTDTDAFQHFVFPYANSLFFINKRIRFHHVTGEVADSNSGAPSVLIAYGEHDSEMIEQSGLDGCHIPTNNSVLFVTVSRGEDKTWRIVVGEALEELGSKAELKDIYKAVEQMAPGKLIGNNHHQAKIRQTLQKHFTKVGLGKYTC